MMLGNPKGVLAQGITSIGVERADAVQVTNGLKAGEVVVIDPPSALGPGTQVQTGS